MTRAQLRAAGITDSSISRRRRNGHLTPVHLGVFAVGHEAPMDYADEAAALLACGTHSALAGHSAATLWGMRRGTARPIHVLVPADRRTGRPSGVIVHRSTILTPRDICLHETGLPVTSPAWTLLVVAVRLPEDDLEYVLAEGMALGLLELADVDELLARAGRHPGVHALTRLRARTAAPRRTESGGERTFLALVRAAKLPLPKTQVPLLGYRVDFLWPEAKVVVEFDDYSTHGSPYAFGRDRRKDAALQAAGYVVIRVTRDRIAKEPHVIVKELTWLLATRSPTPI